MFFVSLLVLSTARAAMVKTQKGSVCRPKGNPSGGYCTIPSFEAQISAAECLQKCDDWADCMCGVASDLKNGKFYCHLFVGDNVAPTSSVCQSVLGAKAVGGAYHPFGKLKCGSKYTPGTTDGDSVSIYESDFEYADSTCPRAVNGKIRSAKGKTCRPNGNGNGGYCTIPSFSKQYAPSVCLSKCEQWDKCECGVASDLKNGAFYCHLFTGENVAPTKEECEKVFDNTAAVQGVYQPWGALKCNTKYPLADAEGETVSVHNPNFVYKENCPIATAKPVATTKPIVTLAPTIASKMVRSSVGNSCRPKGNQNGGYCTIPSFAKQITPEECLTKCENWDECKCGIASDLKNGAFYCHLFTGENVAPTKEECVKVFGNDAAVQGAYQPYGALKCRSTYSLGAADGKTVSVYDPTFQYKENCPMKMTRLEVGQTCRKRGTSNGGYCTMPSNVKHPSPEECLTKCENWDECKCGIASDLKNGNFYCHLFIGENVAPTKETCEKVFGSTSAIQGMYQPWGPLSCGSGYTPGDADGLKTVSVYDELFVHSVCPKTSGPEPTPPPTKAVITEVTTPKPSSTCWKPVAVGYIGGNQQSGWYWADHGETSLNECFKLCEATNGCKAVDWQADAGGRCNLRGCSLLDSKCAGARVVNKAWNIYECRPEPVVTPKPSQGSSTCWKQVADGYIGGNQQSGWYWGDHGKKTLEECFKLCEATNGCKSVDWQADAGGRCNLRGCSLLDSKCAAARVDNKLWNIYECRVKDITEVVTPKPSQPKINCFASEFVRQKVQTATSGEKAREHEAVAGSGMVTNFAKDTMSGGSSGCKSYCAGTKYAVWWQNTAVTPGEYHSFFCRCHNVCVDKTANAVYKATVYELQKDSNDSGKECGRIGRIKKGPKFKKLVTLNAKSACECSTACKNKSATEWTFKARNGVCRCLKNAKIVDFTTSRKRTTVGYFASSVANVVQ